MNKIQDLDLNLLKVFLAVYDARSVSNAAEELGLSQSGVSRALGRLRDQLNDSVFVRSGGEMLPTHLGERLEEPVRKGLARIERALRADEDFSPGELERHFTVATADYCEALFGPLLLETLAKEAPGVELTIVSTVPDDREYLRKSSLDLVLGARPERGRLRSQGILKDRFVCIVREGHPVLEEEWSIDNYIEYAHILVSPHGKAGSVVDDALAERNLERRVALRLQSFMAAIPIAAKSDLIVTLPEQVAHLFDDHYNIAVLEPPLELPIFTLVQSWHERSHEDSAHQWLRSIFKRIGSELQL